jgi:teichuronic acid biosynthesis protein TuaE
MSARALPRPALTLLVVGTGCAGLLAAVSPQAGLALGIVGLTVALLRTTDLPQLGRVGIIVAAVAAILGPNLAVPGAPSVFAFRIVIVLLGLGLAGYVLMDGRLVVPRGLPRAAGLLVALVLWSVLSIFWSGNTAAALRWTLFLTMMSGLAVGIALACRSRVAAIRLLIALGITFTVATAAALAELRLGIRLPTSALAGKDAGFATSLFGNQNNFATYLSLTLPYFVCLPIVFRDARLIALGAFGGLVTLTALLFTGSRSNLAATFLVLAGLVLVLATDRRRRGRLVAGACVAGLAALLIIPSLGGGGLIPLPARVAEKFDIGQFLQNKKQSNLGSAAVRSSLLDEGLGLVADSNGLGVGAGNAETSMRSLANFTGIENLHNWWLELLVNLGVVGLALYIGLYLTLIRGQLRAARRATDPLVRWLGLSGALALVGFTVGSLGPSSVIHFAPMWITFGLGMLTLVMARATPTPATETAPTP